MPSTSEKPDFDTLNAQCERFVGWHYRAAPREVLQQLAEAAGDAGSDNYGGGELIEGFEREIAALLGKEAAVFMPSGTMAQQIAMRIWSDRKGCRTLAWHPKCHLEIHEQKGYQMLHGLHAKLVGHPERLLTLEDLQAVREPVSALLLELPQREIGGQLPGWEALQAQLDWAHERGAAAHMDGARLWESQPYYGRSYAEISAGFDSVYVSFYKMLAGITGAVLAGPADFIAEARVWQRRYGGNLRAMYPYVLSARLGLQRHLPRIPEYVAKAHEVAKSLSGLAGISIVPNPPHTTMMHIFLRGDKQRLEDNAIRIAQERKVFVFYGLSPTLFDDLHKLELTTGEATLDFSGDELAALFEAILA